MVKRTMNHASFRDAVDSSADSEASSAPLARVESYDDEETIDDGVINVTMTLDEDEEDVFRPTTIYVQPTQKPATNLGSNNSLFRRFSSKKRQKAATESSSSSASAESTREPASAASPVIGNGHKSSNFLPREPVTDIERLTLVVSRLIELIDEHGLSTDGIYRKSGTFSKVKRLRRKVQKIINNAKDLSSVDFDEYINDVHVLTSVLKSLLREMKEPLFTGDLHPIFEAETGEERTQAIQNAIQRLPITHQVLLEKLLHHLTRVVDHESDNRMSVESLAIVFAPNIFPSQQSASLNADVVKQRAKCVQYLIETRMDKRRTEGRTVVDNGEIVTDEGRLARNVDLQSQTPDSLDGLEQPSIDMVDSSLINRTPLEHFYTADLDNRVSCDDDTLSDSVQASCADNSMELLTDTSTD